MLSVAVVLIFAVTQRVAVFCESPHSGFVSDLKKLDLRAPNVSPYDSLRGVNPFGGLDQVCRKDSQSRFLKAFYNPSCSNTSIVKPVYYWPGQLVELPCHFCQKFHLYNGLMKHWAVIRENIQEELQNINKTNSWDVFEPVQNFTKQKKNLSNSIPDDSISENYEDDNDALAFSYYFYDVPFIKFFQRNGRLIIISAQLEDHGLYRCFDAQNIHTTNFVYYLIPYTPSFSVLNSLPSDTKLHDFKCFYPGEVKDFWHITEGYHYYSLYASQLDTALAQLEKDPNIDLFDAAEQPPSYDIPEFKDKFKRDVLFTIFNLQLVIPWSEWSVCSYGGRTRTGLCHIRKSNSSIKFATSNKTLGIPQFIKNIHHLIESVDDFQETGIPLFSSAFAKVFTNFYGGQCTFHPQLILDLHEQKLLNIILLASPNFISKFTEFADEKVVNTLCFHYIIDTESVSFMRGFNLTQYEKC